MTLETVTVVIVLAAAAAALVGLNRRLQRVARPDKGAERIAGCCAMALPEALLRTEAEAQLPPDSASRNKITSNISSADNEDNQDNKDNEEHHEL